MPTVPPRRFARARLMRLPLALTTVTDIWAGALTAPTYTDAPAVSVGTLALLHAAAFCCYCAGMTLNDVFDATRDRDLHPGRPIPKGLVTLRGAAIQGAILLVGGVGFALLAGPRHGVTGLVLAAAILAYDAGLKRWAVPGAIAMGAIRYLDVQLGAGFAAGPWFPPALVLGAYVATLTWISTREERPDDSKPLIVAVYVLCGLLAVAGYQYPLYLASVWFFSLVAAAAMLFGTRAQYQRQRGAVQRLVLVLLLGIFVVNGGSLAGCGRWGFGIAAAALAGSFFALKWILGRWEAHTE